MRSSFTGLLLLLITGCGQSVPLVATKAQPLPQLATLDRLSPAAPVSHASRADKLLFNIAGTDAALRSPAARTAGTSLVLDSTPGSVVWAIYSLPTVAAPVEVIDIELQVVAGEVWLLHANFTTATWEPAGSFTSDPGPLVIEGAQYLSPVGSQFIALLVINDASVVIDSVAATLSQPQLARHTVVNIDTHLFSEVALVDMTDRPGIVFSTWPEGLQFACPLLDKPRSQADWVISKLPARDYSFHYPSAVFFDGRPVVLSANDHAAYFSSVQYPLLASDWGARSLPLDNCYDLSGLAVVGGNLMLACYEIDSPDADGDGAEAYLRVIYPANPSEPMGEWRAQRIMPLPFVRNGDGYLPAIPFLTELDGRAAIVCRNPEASELTFAEALFAAPESAADWKVSTVHGTHYAMPRLLQADGELYVTEGRGDYLLVNRERPELSYYQINVPHPTAGAEHYSYKELPLTSDLVTVVHPFSAPSSILWFTGNLRQVLQGTAPGLVIPLDSPAPYSSNIDLASIGGDSVVAYVRQDAADPSIEFVSFDGGD
jgi:hypothetical protein